MAVTLSTFVSSIGTVVPCGVGIQALGMLLTVVVYSCSAVVSNKQVRLPSDVA